MHTYTRCPQCNSYLSYISQHPMQPSYWNRCLCACSMRPYPVYYRSFSPANIPCALHTPSIPLSQNQDLVPVVIEFNIPALLEKFPGLKGEHLRNHPYRQEIKAKYNDWINHIKEKITAPSMNIRHTLNLLVSGIAVTLTKEQIEKLEDLQLPFIKAIYPDEKVTTDTQSITHHHPLIQQEMDLNQHNLEIIGIPQVREMKDGYGNPLDGRLVRVAVLDYGFDLRRLHFGPEGKVIDPYNFRDKNTDVLTPDNSEHGTMITQILLDVAPNIQIALYKVFYNSDIAAGFDRAVQFGVEVVNISLGPLLKTDLIITAAKTAVANGVIVVNSSGNNSKSDQVSIPGTSPIILSVGATNEVGDQVASFSNYDATLLRPDVVAPGYYRFESTIVIGTSFAAPYVSGAVALILQMHPNWTPFQVMSALATTATPIRERSPDALFSQGSGRIDAFAAINTDIFISPTRLSVFAQLNTTTQHTIEIYSTDNAEQTLQILIRTANLPPGISITFPSHIAIPAKEQSTLPLRFKIDRATPIGAYMGEIYLTSGTKEWHIPIHLEVSRY